MPTAARLRYTLVAGATAVVIGTGFTLVGLDRSAADTTDTRSATAPQADAPAPADVAVPGPDLGLLPSEDATSATLPASPSAAPSTSRARTTPATRATSKPAAKATPRPRATTTAPARRPGTAPRTAGSVLDQVLAHINDARADEGLPAYTLDDDLSRAAALHNRLMIDGCGLKHQCAGETGIGARFSAQGVRWRSAGENIGLGSAGSSTAEMVRAANGLTDSMLAETPPADGHRRNLLSDGFTRIGLSVVRDDKGIVWFTQDFVG